MRRYKGRLRGCKKCWYIEILCLISSEPLRESSNVCFWKNIIFMSVNVRKKGEKFLLKHGRKVWNTVDGILKKTLRLYWKLLRKFRISYLYSVNCSRIKICWETRYISQKKSRNRWLWMSKRLSSWLPSFLLNMLHAKQFNPAKKSFYNWIKIFCCFLIRARFFD